MIWVGHVAGKGAGKGACRILLGKHEGSRPFGYPGVDGRITLK